MAFRGITQIDAPVAIHVAGLVQHNNCQAVLQPATTVPVAGLGPVSRCPIREGGSPDGQL